MTAAGYSLGTFRPGATGGRTFAGAVLDDGIVLELAAAVRHLGGDLRAPTTVDEIAGSWASWFPEVGRIVDAARTVGFDGGLAGAVHELAALDVRPPLRPRQIVQAGANFRQHVIEMTLLHDPVGGNGATTEADRRAAAARAVDEQRRGGIPYLFLGSPNALCGARDDVLLPAASAQNDWELELAAVIGAPARHVRAADALAHVAGYAIANDLTSRDLIFRTDIPRLGADWLRAKNWPTALPVGPFLVPAAFVREPMALDMELRLNGEVMQHASTADMLFGIADLVAYASSVTMLQPGDLVLTGSPAGNGAQTGRFLRPGDVLEGTIQGLGRQRNRCSTEPSVDEPATPRPERAHSIGGE